MDKQGQPQDDRRDRALSVSELNGGSPATITVL